MMHSPWLLSPMECLMYNIELGRDYPKPIVDLKHSYAKAQELLWHWREKPEVKREKYRLLKEPLNNVTEDANTRQKRTKKRSLHV